MILGQDAVHMRECTIMRQYLASDVTAVGLLAALVLTGCDAATTGACVPGNNVICGIVKPEDIEAMPDSRWLLVSELGGKTSPGRVVAIDPTTRERRTLVEGPVTAGEPSSTFPRCGSPPDVLRPRGFHLGRDQDGERLLVIAGTRVEQFRLDRKDGDELALAWQGCVDIPPEFIANDVAGLTDGGFVVSHMYDPPRDWTLDLRMFLGLNTGAAVAWSARDGWRRVPDTDVSFANGIQVEPATERIFVSSMFTQRVIVVDRDGGNRRETARGPNQIDNLTWASDGRLVGAGHTGVAVYGISTCRKAGETPCSFPFAVTAINPTSLAIETLFTAPTGAIPGASVALLKDGALYLGTVFGEQITRVPVIKR